MDIKLYFVDLDGTLLDKYEKEEKSISYTNRMAIKKAQEKGKHVVISTGRIGEVPFNYMLQAGVEYAVFGNGSQVVDATGKTLHLIPIKADSMKRIKEACKKYNLGIKIDTTRIAYGINKQALKFIPLKIHYEMEEGYDFDDSIDRQKLIMWSDNAVENRSVIIELRKDFPELSFVLAERGFTIEVTDINATKGKTNEWVAKNLFDIHDKKGTAHIGDTLNDLPAVEHVEYFIAMKDAEPDLLVKAKYIGPLHFEHGVAKVLNGDIKLNPLYIED